MSEARGSGGPAQGEDDKKSQDMRLASLRRKVKDISTASRKPGTARLVQIFVGTVLLLLLLVLVSWYQESGYVPTDDSSERVEVLGKKAKGKKASLINEEGGRRSGRKGKKSSRSAKKAAMEADGGKISKSGSHKGGQNVSSATRRVMLPPGETCELTHSRVAYTYDRLEQAALIQTPFPFLYVEQVFEPGYYLCLLAHLPLDTAKDTKAVYRKKKSTSRYTLPMPHNRNPSHASEDMEAWAALGKEKSLNTTFWETFSSSFSSLTMRDIFLSKFAVTLGKRGGDRLSVQESDLLLELHRDRKGFTMGPHTDGPERLVSSHFYLPRNMDNSKMGTTLIESPGGLTQADSKRLSWSEHDFQVVRQMVYAPNSLFAFAPCLSSWHAVPEWILPKGSRDSIQGIVVETRLASAAKADAKVGIKAAC